MSTAENVITEMDNHLDLVIDARKCAYELCGCPAELENKYCSTYCGDVDKSQLMEIKCDCEHQNCR